MSMNLADGCFRKRSFVSLYGSIVLLYFVFHYVILVNIGGHSCGYLSDQRLKILDELKDNEIEIFSTTKICDESEICRSRSLVISATIRNWLIETDFVTVFVDEEEQCKSLPKNVRCMKHECSHHEYNLPIVKCILQHSFQLSRADTIVFTNDDIVFKNLTLSTRLINQKFSTFAMTGRRTNVKTGYIDDESALLSLEQYATDIAHEGTLDYFCLKLDTSVLDTFPGYLIGNWRWDNSLLDFMILKNIPTIDGTKTIKAFHLGKSDQIMQIRPASKYNDNLFKDYKLNTTEEATEIKKFVCSSNNSTTTNSGRFGRLSCCQLKTSFLGSNKLIVH